MDEYTPPCTGRTEWFAETDPTLGRTEAEVAGDRANVIRAKLICYTRCKMREQCLKFALDIQPTIPREDWFVWGGTDPRERQELRENGHIMAPATVTRKLKPADVDKINLFIDSVAHPDDLADYWGHSSAHAVNQRMRKYLWTIRLGDPLVRSRANHATTTDTELLGETSQSVAAA